MFAKLVATLLLGSFIVAHKSSAEDGDVKLVPPYDIWRSTPTPLYSVGPYSVTREPVTDKPHVLRVMWRTGLKNGQLTSGVAVEWSDGTITRKLPKFETPPRRSYCTASEIASSVDYSYKYHFILQPDEKSLKNDSPGDK